MLQLIWIKTIFISFSFSWLQDTGSHGLTGWWTNQMQWNCWLRVFNWLNKSEWLQDAKTTFKKWSTPGFSVSKHSAVDLLDRLPQWSCDNPLLSAANEVQRAKERVNQREGGLKQWLLYLIQHGFWGMKHAQPINDFLLFSPVSFRATLACGLRLLHLIVSASLSSLTKEKP